jgi:hypothetical protein
VLSSFLALGIPAAADAQTSTNAGPLANVRFDTSSGGARTPAPTVPLRFDAPTPALRQAGGMPINGIVFGGLNTGFGSAGFAVGGGAQLSNVADREEFGLQFDVLFSNVGECVGCLDDDDFSAWQFAISGAFIYKFRETTTGWRPFAGGGVVFTRFSFSLDDDFVCDVINVDCSESVSEVGIQAQGGIARGNLHFEGRVQGTAGGGFLALVGYKFGGQ